MSKTEIRRHSRIPYSGRVRFSWEDSQGRPRFATGKCLDISDEGLRLEVIEAIPQRTIVSLQAEQVRFGGSAVVKHVARRGSKYAVGLELTQALLDKTLSAIRAGATSGELA